MRVETGAGEFELSVEKVYKKEKDLMMIGKMGIWEAEITVTPEEFADLMRVSMIPPVILMMAKLPFVWLGQKLRGKRSN